MISDDRLKIEDSWLPLLQDEFSQVYINELRDFLREQYAAGKTIFPAKEDYFKALNLTPFDQLKVVILGQDPYHGDNQAHGLCFSVPPRLEKLPPSLRNIYKELNADLGIPMPEHGCLQAWAEQGVLLLNSVLTVEQGLAASHQGKGWERLTDHIIKQINEHAENIVFVLWGSYAQKKGAFIDPKKHLVLKSVHPSPLSAHRGFFGQQPFSKINQYLEQHEKSAIQWQLPSKVAAIEAFNT